MSDPDLFSELEAILRQRQSQQSTRWTILERVATIMEVATQRNTPLSAAEITALLHRGFGPASRQAVRASLKTLSVGGLLLCTGTTGDIDITGRAISIPAYALSKKGLESRGPKDHEAVGDLGVVGHHEDEG